MVDISVTKYRHLFDFIVLVYLFSCVFCLGEEGGGLLYMFIRKILPECAFVDIHTHTLKHTYTHIHIHTHTHTNTHSVSTTLVCSSLLFSYFKPVHATSVILPRHLWSLPLLCNLSDILICPLKANL